MLVLYFFVILIVACLPVHKTFSYPWSICLSMYLFIQFIIGSTIINVNVGVKQVSPTSYLWMNLLDSYQISLRVRWFLEMASLSHANGWKSFTSHRSSAFKFVECWNASSMLINEDKTELLLFLQRLILIMTHCFEYHSFYPPF